MITLDGEVKLLDFGIAKALAETTSERTRTGTLKGKFGYMAPETLDGAAANHLSDQFSVGVLLHEALTGQRLFRGESDVQTIARVKALQVPLPSAMGAGSEDALDRICLRALERDPTARFADCQEMARALGAVVERAGFGPGQAAAFLREVFPAGVERAPLALVPTEERQATVPRRSAGTTRKRGRVVFPVAATVVMLAAIGGAVWRARVAKDPVSVIIDAPAEGRLTQTPPPTMPFPELVLPARPNGTPPSRPEPPPTLSKLRTSHRTPVRARPLHAAATERTTAPLRPAAPPRPTRTERPAATEASQERKIRTGQVVDPFAR